MKNYRETSPTKLDNVLCALIVAVVLGSVGYAALGPMLGGLAA